MRGLTNSLVILVSLAASLRADQYWVAYEGNDFPENEGWTRHVREGGARRSIEEGALVLDSRESVLITDWYSLTRSIDPTPGEHFLLQWRLLIDESFPSVDATVSVFSDSSRGVGFEFDENGIRSVFEGGVAANFAAGTVHDFELRSDDMQTYDVRIDGDLAIHGEFVDVFTRSQVSWGDGIFGGSSLTNWDYFRFGVVPEPQPWLLLILSVHCVLRASRRTS
jgi:hypothetical protein